MMIAHDYGERLSTDNVKPEALNQLVAGYPSHSFVIDRKEAETLFRRVRRPTDEEKALIALNSSLLYAGSMPNDATMQYLSGTRKSAARTMAGGTNNENTQPTNNVAGSRESHGSKAVGDCEPKPARPTGQAAEGGASRSEHEEPTVPRKTAITTIE